MNLNCNIFYSGSLIDFDYFKKISNKAEIKVFFILHGLFGRAKNWQSVTKELSLRLPYYFFTIDQRNHGQNPPSSKINYELMVNDIYKFYKSLDIKELSLLGHSMGGKVSMMFALKYPIIINNLIIVDIAPVRYFSKDEENIDYLLQMDITKFKTRLEADEELSKNIKDKNLRLFLLQNLVYTNLGYRWSLNLKTIKNNIDELRSFSNEEMKSFQKQVLCIYGEKSNYLTQKNIEVFKTYFPFAKFSLIEEAGHWLHSEKPERFIKEICKYLI
tara:strand:- start:9 stop:827 length:819 start_codon:yes stop_codon:yes gene_type:complete